MKQQLLVNMDGVLADIYTQFLKYELEETGILPPVSRLRGKPVKEAFPYFDKHIRMPGFFRNVPVIENCEKRLKYLSEKYEVLVISVATEYPESILDKCNWLKEHFPFISWQQLIFCGSKLPIAGDILIDDNPTDLDSFQGKKILFTQPHNVFIQNSSYIRINHWDEILLIL